LDSMASALVRHQAVVAFDSSACDRLFAEVLHDQPLVLNIVLSDLTGMIKGTALPLHSGAAPAAALPRVREAVIASGKPIVTELTNGVVTGKPTVILAYPVRREGSDAVDGVLGIGLDLAKLQRSEEHTSELQSPDHL